MEIAAVSEQSAAGVALAWFLFICVMYLCRDGETTVWHIDVDEVCCWFFDELIEWNTSGPDCVAIVMMTIATAGYVLDVTRYGGWGSGGLIDRKLHARKQAREGDQIGTLHKNPPNWYWCGCVFFFSLLGSAIGGLAQEPTRQEKFWAVAAAAVA
jgi:hypothetical protein